MNAMTATRLQGLVGRVYNPKRVNKYTEINNSIDRGRRMSDCSRKRRVKGKLVNKQNSTAFVKLFQRRWRKTS